MIKNKPKTDKDEAKDRYRILRVWKKLKYD